MQSLAVMFAKPEQLSLQRLELTPLGSDDVVVDVDWSGISTGTERLLWNGRMPQFPGFGYPLVPGYESVGRIVSARAGTGLDVGDRVFVPGATCFKDARALFGATARRLVVPASRALKIDEDLGERGALLALAATAHHAVPVGRPRPVTYPELIVGHGVLGRLIARLVVAGGGNPPVVWESNAARREGAVGYAVVAPDDDERRDYACICDVSGDETMLDELVMRLARGGEIILAGFYAGRVNFAFAPAFMREVRLRIAAQWQAEDLVAARTLIETGRLSLDGLVTHVEDASDAQDAYATAFGDAECLKMIIDWRGVS
jgi:3-hydroxyethyl bacteriochlorophyllide a dehydrogenase